MDKSAVVLDVGAEDGFGEDKGLLKLDNRPLLTHVVKAAKGLVEEMIVIVSSKAKANAYRKIVPSDILFVEDPSLPNQSLSAAKRGFETARGTYSLVLPIDSPFVSQQFVSLLFELSLGKTAVVPRWPNNQCEPLHAVYNTQEALKACEKCLAAGEVDLTSILRGLHGVRYVSTLVIEQIDPDFRSFFRVKTPLDLKKAAVMAKPRKNQ